VVASAASASNTNSDGVSQKVKDQVAKYQEEPTGIFDTEPVTGKIPPKTVGFVVCLDPICFNMAKSVKQATDALGWKLITANQGLTDPQGAYTQLIDQKVDYIMESPNKVSEIPAAFAAMKKAGIPLFEMENTDKPLGPKNNIYSNTNGDGTITTYTNTAFLIQDTKGKANILTVTVPGYSALIDRLNQVKSYLKANCPKCKHQTLEVTIPDLVQGNVPTKVVSALQRDPSINTVNLFVPSGNDALVSTLKTAGLLDKVTIFGGADSVSYQNVIDGTYASATAYNARYDAWMTIHQMIALAQGKWTPKMAADRYSAAKYFLVDTPKEAKALVNSDGGWNGPKGYEDAYLKLWGVGGKSATTTTVAAG
jgi:ABC-type sugar transport system substrate-binding protein